MKTRRRTEALIVRQGTLHVDGQDPVPISHRLLVGRSDGSSSHVSTNGTHLFLQDPEISRCHCAFDPTADGIELEDLGATNGTFVNGIRILKALLNERCTVQLGNTRIEFRPAEPRREMVNVAERFGDLIGRSPTMRRAFALLQRAATAPIDIMLRAETGTGKDLAARAIHEGGPRRGRPFVVVDCTSISPTLAEAELFGSCKGAFTGATTTKQGPFELADTGTIFLDEIGELGLDMQAKLLRVLQARTIRRVGETVDRKVNVRVLSATNRDLTAMVNEGKFRQDLYYRLGVEVHLPPLREHTEDIPLLVEKFCRALDVDAHSATANAYIARRFKNYHWPGNVRELGRIVDESIMRGVEFDNSIDLPHQPSPHPPLDTRVSSKSENHATVARVSFQKAKSTALAKFEREYFISLYESSKGNISEMARRSAMKRDRVVAKLREHKLRGEG